MTNGWPAPASQELGANWVGVTARERRERRFNQETETFEAWPATARGFGSGPGDEPANVFQVGVAFLNLGRAAGVGQPFARYF